jgi:hypothetical protein
MQQAMLNATSNFCLADARGGRQGQRLSGQEKTVMNLEIWLPAMFLLGLAVMGLCYAFLIACEKI